MSEKGFESKLASSKETRDRVKSYCEKRGLKQYWWVNHVINELLDKLEKEDHE